MFGEIEDFIDYLRKVKNKSENTIVSYRRDLTKLNEYFIRKGKNTVEGISEKDLEDFIMSLKEQNLKSSTVSRSIASTKAFFHFLAGRGKINGDISENLKAPKIEKKLPEVLTVEETTKLLDQPDTDTIKGLRDKSMLELLYATGIRVTELINLKVEDLDFKTDHLHCHEKGRERFIPFGNQAKEVLERYLKSARKVLLGSRTSEFLFTNINGEVMSRQGVWKILKFYGKKAGINKEITPHTIRHSFAVHLIENGADLKNIQKMLGHSDISTTQFYTRFSDNSERAQYRSTHPREKKKQENS